jgi:multidrug efflux pump subunit AcrA (membrane-fusion protein)
MSRLLLPAVGVLVAVGAAVSVARTQPRREATDPPAPPPEPQFSRTIAAAGLVEASTENISIGTPLAGVVERVFVTPGDAVSSGDPLFVLDRRQLRADLDSRRHARAVASAQVVVAAARLEDWGRQLQFAEQVSDKRAVSAEEVSRRRSAVETASAEQQEARARLAWAEAQVRAAEVELERSTVRAPIDAEVLQVKVRAGEFAPAAPTSTPLVLLGRLTPLHVRVDVDEHEGWRVHAGARAVAHVRGNAASKASLRFVRFEPFVVPKRALTGDSTERVDTRVLQVIYRVEDAALPLFVGQQLDVFIDAETERAGG